MASIVPQQRRPRCCGIALLLLTAWSFGPTSAYYIDPGDVIVGIGGLYSYHFEGQSAAFGSSLESIYGVNLNLMLPPEEKDLYLCDFPVIRTIELENSNNDTNPFNTTTFYNGGANVKNDSGILIGNTALANSSDTSAAQNPYHALLSQPLHPPSVLPMEHRDVTLLVPYGKCLPEQKASVAWRIQQEYPQFGRVSRLIVYNTDGERMDDLMTLTASKEWRIDGWSDGSNDNNNSQTRYPENSTRLYDNDNSEGLGVVFVSTRTAEVILSRLQDEVTFVQPDASPHFGQESNDRWRFPVSFLPIKPQGQLNYYTDDQLSPPSHEDGDYHPEVYTYRGNDGSQMEADFYWFRLVVFSLLVVSPCIRAAYLWYAGGARIRFRYNEEGRIIGLQYIPPMPYWFAPRPDEGYPPTAARMTREEVLALPEITYHLEQSEHINNTQGDFNFVGSAATTASSDPLEQPNEVQQQSEQLAGSSVVNCDAAGDLETGNAIVDSDGDNDDSGQRLRIASKSLLGSDTATTNTEDDQPSSLDQTPTSSQTVPLPETSDPQQLQQFEGCTTCSICIDDFEEGERLRLLPRCRHIFHTGCIMPWLTERQGCCPLCKTPVIEGEDYNDDNDDVAAIMAPFHMALSDSDSGIEENGAGVESDAENGNNQVETGVSQDGGSPQQYNGGENIDPEAQEPVIIIEEEPSNATDRPIQR